MLPRHRNLPTQWLMTDERLGDDLWAALEALPRGGGVIFRHYAATLAERQALFARVATIARRRRLVLIRAGDAYLGPADGVHGPAHGRGAASGRGQGPRRRLGQGQGIRTCPVHSRREALAAIDAGADLLFVSPVFATRSHPGTKPLGRMAAASLIRGLAIPAIALGGMSARRFAGLNGFYGWAAIDAWAAPIRQKRNAVPI